MTGRSWRWIELDVVLAIHERQLAEHGGLEGIRDFGAIESAIARGRNLAAYAEPDAAALAASYASGLCRSHGFADGNKRTAWIAARLFLADNGSSFHFDPADAIRIMISLASGAMDEEQLAGWFRERIMTTTR